ncbi:DUF4302 domain-containing protein [Polaribacter cellanae]|uniref:DUF4302 domain-containing protein n=1 Tax=Polaribacter cellanae TaxID=2818493 RepID=A0A975HAA8_9FLAO|nr:DUF4302 domain-containing protein [Polaribacter cellanae]QTE24105.1 DUF4302 domain-containing protein [Polaribacter cellanae]
MKKYKKIFKTLALFNLCIIAFSSCQQTETKELFDQSATKRFNAKEKELSSLLTSAENGWHATYFTDDSSLGGYTFLFKFKKDGKVSTASDLTSDTSVKESEYDINIGTTVQLSFTTRGPIHKLSDSNNGPFKGQGYRGAFDFSYYGKDGEDLLFRDVKAFKEIRFKKATANDWTDIRKNATIRNLITGQSLAYEVNKEVNFFSYNNIRRFATNKNSKVKKTNFGIGFSSTGILISPSVVADNGMSYSELTLNDKRNKFVSEDGKFSIFILSTPFDVNQNWRIRVGVVGEVSKEFSKTFNAISKSNTSIYSETLSTTIRFGNTFRDTPAGILFRSFSDPTTGAGYWAEYTPSFSAAYPDLEMLNITRSVGAYNWRFYKHLDPLIALIVDNAPYELEKTPSDNPTSIKLTSKSNPDVWFTIRR